jgi:NAD(P)-dependent dehydrogenase (short-subunit alcohol dehydrogenase family)
LKHACEGRRALVGLSRIQFALGASKAAIEKLSKSMAAEFARQDIPIRVNVIAPGLFPSQLITEEKIGLDTTKPLHGLMNPIPLHRAGT